MKIVEYNNTKYIILDDDDEDIRIASRDSSSLVRISNREGNLRTYNIPLSSNKTTSNDIHEILMVCDTIEKCDNWLKEFREVHDEFKKIALSEIGGCYLNISFSEYSSPCNKKERTINLSLRKRTDNRILKEGVIKSLSEDYIKIYEYLVAHVLSYYIKENHIPLPFDNLDEFTWILHSYSKNADGNAIAISICELRGLYSSPSLFEIVNELLCCNDIDATTDKIISNLRRNIENQSANNNYKKY